VVNREWVKWRGRNDQEGEAREWFRGWGKVCVSGKPKGNDKENDRAKIAGKFRGGGVGVVEMGATEEAMECFINKKE